MMSVRTAEAWRKLLSEYQSLGEPIGLFCQRHKINVSTFYYWVGKEAKSNKPAPKLLPVVEHESLPLDSVEISLPKGITLRFSPGASSGYVAAILKGLG
jgi:hypothetical protein